MHRNQYLGNDPVAPTGHVVRDFVCWLAANLYNKTLFAHQYTDRRSKKALTFDDLPDAHAQYYWPHHGALGTPSGVCLASSDVTLNALGNALKTGLSLKDDQRTLSAAIGIMKWGGVSAGNVRWLTLNSAGLAQQIESTAAALATGNPADPILLSTLLRFNAGMTKVYSLLVKDFIIYDSRVAAALGWIVVKYCQHQKLATVPAELAFPWAPAKSAPGALTPKNRNPSQGTLQFPRLNSAVQHAEWNLRASWILAKVLEKAAPGTLTAAGPIAPLRSLEAALFMIGYDLPPSGSTSPVVATTISPLGAPSAGMNECFTVVRRKQFYYSIDADGIQMASGRRHTISQINDLLSALWQAFGSASFPLANSATKVRAGAEPLGIGVAYFKITNRKGNPPDTSALAAVLHEIGALRYAPGATHDWSINIGELLVEPGATSIDIKPLINREVELSELL